jgi:hypothetical protein
LTISNFIQGKDRPQALNSIQFINSQLEKQSFLSLSKEFNSKVKDSLKDRLLWQRLSEEASSLDSQSKLFMTRDLESFVTGGKSP